ncbi:uncharacterized protein LOC118736625 [Rhagoletis pomonella]|uniref:uncharacterized protein LOC118736625 n=1 Tax=Rhagoletis pomonella TaxID=28610 RepID=UPI0017806BCA|nr:uncharacterized protein LOC118736625 [Rhagoletis pomonella]
MAEDTLPSKEPKTSEVWNFFKKTSDTKFEKYAPLSLVQAALLHQSSTTCSSGSVQSKVDQKQSTTKVDVILKKRQYLEQVNSEPNTNPLLYWKVLRNQLESDLPDLAKKFFYIPASSVESEGTFSKAGLIVSDRRSSLKPKTVDVLVFLQKISTICKINKFIKARQRKINGFEKIT